MQAPTATQTPGMTGPQQAAGAGMFGGGPPQITDPMTNAIAAATGRMDAQPNEQGFRQALEAAGLPPNTPMNEKGLKLLQAKLGQMFKEANVPLQGKPPDFAAARHAMTEGLARNAMPGDNVRDKALGEQLSMFKAQMADPHMRTALMGGGDRQGFLGGLFGQGQPPGHDPAAGLQRGPPGVRMGAPQRRVV